MRSSLTLLIAFLALLSAAPAFAQNTTLTGSLPGTPCGNSNEAAAPSIQTSGLTVIVPNDGKSTVTATVTGSGFAAGVQVLWNNAVAQVTTSTASSVGFSLPTGAARPKAGDNVTVQVIQSNATKNGTDASPSVSFLLGTGAPPSSGKPNIVTLVPDEVAAGSSGFTVTVQGQNFTQSSFVTWNGVAQPTQFRDGCTLTFDLTAAEVAKSGVINLAVSPDQNSKPVTFTIVAANQTSLYTRITAGLDLSGASTVPAQEKFFADFAMMAPLRIKGPKLNEADHALDHRLWLWFNPRITAVPQSTPNLNDLFGSGTVQSSAITSGNGNTALGLEFLAGPQLFITKPKNGVRFGSPGKATVVPSLIFAIGATTPLTNLQSSQTLPVSSALGTAFPILNTGCTNAGGSGACTNVTFESPVRNRFYREYYGGFRFNTYFWGEGGKGSATDPCEDVPTDKVCNIYPGNFDILIGQNELVSGGTFKGLTLRLDAFYPFPFAPAFHIYGTVWLRTTKASPVTISGFESMTDPTTYVFPVNVDQDFYRIGLGVDLIQLIRRYTAPKTSTAVGSATP